MRYFTAFTLAITSFLVASVANPVLALPPEIVVTEADFAEERIYSPYAGRDYPDEVLFGDMHFHTELSFDAGLIGTRLDVDAGYRFARGEKLISNSGQPV